MTPNHNDLNRALGRVEGDVGAVKQSIERIEKAVSEGFKDVGDRLDALEAKENQRKGALSALMIFSGFVGGLIVKFGSFIFGGAH